MGLQGVELSVDLVVDTPMAHPLNNYVGAVQAKPEVEFRPTCFSQQILTWCKIFPPEVGVMNFAGANPSLLLEVQKTQAMDS